MTSSRRKALHLRSLLWGRLEGPRSYDDLPADVASAARVVDQIGDDLAELRLYLFDGWNQDEPIVQVHLLATAAGLQVLPSDPSDVPDPHAVWTRRDLEGEAFDEESLDAALHFYALRGEPNVFRRERPGGRPALTDVRAMQQLATQIVDTSSGLEAEGVTPSRLIEDFVRMHWSNDPVSGGLTKDWELSPFGQACFAAVRSVRHVPAEPAEPLAAVTVDPSGPDAPPFKLPPRRF